MTRGKNLLSIVMATVTASCISGPPVPNESQIRSTSERSEATVANSAAIATVAHEGLHDSDKLGLKLRLGDGAKANLFLKQMPVSAQAEFSARQMFGREAILGGVQEISAYRKFKALADGRRVLIEGLSVVFLPPGCPTESTLQSVLAVQPHFTVVDDIVYAMQFDVPGDRGAIAHVWMPMASCTVQVSREVAAN